MSNLIDRQVAINAVEESRRLNHHQDGKEACAHEYEHRHFLKILNDLPDAQRWIPCSERIPEKRRETYWVCTDAGSQHECRWTNNVFGIGESDTWGWSIFDIPQYTKVLAWMPLPEPYIQ